VIDAGGPAHTGDAPAAFLDDLLRRLPIALRDAIDVDHAVEVIELVLHDARAPAVDLDPRGLALDVDPRDDDVLGAAQRKPLAGEGQASLGLFVFVGLARNRRRHEQFGVDDLAPPGAALIVLIRVRVYAQTD